MVGNFAPSFSRNFLSIFVHISGAIRPGILIWVLLERPFPSAEVEQVWIMVKSDGVRSGRKAKARHGRLLPT